MRLERPGHVQHVSHAAQMDRAPRLTSLAGHASERIAAVLATAATLAVVWRRLTKRFPDLWDPAGWIGCLDPPPPRAGPAHAI